jgi:hypothetical protein
LPIGPTTVTWTATDEAGNSASCTQLIMVVDNTNPEITCPSATQVAVNTGCSFGGSFGVATASDNCSIQANIAVTNDAPSLLPLGQTLVTWTATDEAGNSASCTQLVTVVDETPPEISCPAAVDIPINLSCSYLGEFGVPTATDNCSDTGAIEVVNDAPGVLPLGPTMVTWTATDEAGNSASCTQLVTVVDLTPPTITCPETLTVSTNSGCTRVGAIGVPTVSDGCSAPGDISITNDAPAALPLGRTLVTWTATDEAGNSASCVQTVVVEDTEAPSIACPQAVTLGTNAGCGYIGGTNDPVISDNCSAVENITIVNDAPAQFPLGPTLVTWTATDEAGNSASCTQLVTIVDDDAPSISCPSDSAVGTNVGCTYVGAIGLASATDNCSSVGNVTVTNDAPESFPLGETMVTWTATDEAGNSASCVQVVTVADDDAPVIVCPVPATFGTNTGCTYVGPLAPPTASDECSAASNITITSDAPAELLLGTTMVTWTATDESGNISSCTQLVTVVDDDAPGVVCPARNTFGTNSGCSYVGDIGAPIVSDNCSLSVAISVTNDAPSSFQTGTTQVTWTVTDEAGNSSSCVQEVVVVDDDAPELEPPSPVTFDVNMGCSYVGDFASPPIAVDNCSTLADIRFTHDAPVAFPPGATEVTWTATDAEGNVETVTQEVIVLDGIPPSLSCPGEVTLAADSAGCVFSGDIPPPLVSDNCSPPAAITIENDAPASLEAGSTSVTWRATDELGNVVTCQTLVTIEDRAPPALICPADIFASCTTQNGAVVDFTVEAVDECDQTPTITVEPASGSLFAPGVTVVFARATDSQGNSSTCTFSVSVNCEQGGFQIPGDCNQDGTFDISDPVCLLGFLFLGSPQGLPCGSGTRDDPSNQALYAWNAEEIDLSSAVQALQFLFFGTGEGHPLGEECLQMPDCPEVCDAGGA